MIFVMFGMKSSRYDFQIKIYILFYLDFWTFKWFNILIPCLVRSEKEKEKKSKLDSCRREGDHKRKWSQTVLLNAALV